VNLSYLVEIPDFGSVESETEMDGDGNHTAISNTGMKFIGKYRCPRINIVVSYRDFHINQKHFRN